MWQDRRPSTEDETRMTCPDAIGHLRALHAASAGAYPFDCLRVARELRSLLLREGIHSSLIRLRRHERRGDGLMVWPLIPLRYAGRDGPAWTTHYACCADGMVFDPPFAEPVATAGYALRAFGVDVVPEIVD